MRKRDVLSTDEMKGILSVETNETIKHFLTYYKGKRSKAQYTSAINNLLYELGLQETSKLTFTDYIKVIPQKDNEKTPQDIYKESFFKYLYAFNLLEDPRGFSDVWVKNRLHREFTRRKQPKDKKVEADNSSSLSLVEILSIQKVLEQDFTKIEMRKMEFCWYMLFEIGCAIEEIKEVKSVDFSNGVILTSKGNISIPEKFYPLFEELNSRESSYKGFYTVNKLIEDLGNLAGLNKKLMPSHIKKARNENTLKCSNCGDIYSNLTNNWVTLNNRVICKYCSEEIKKNSSFHIEINKISEVQYEAISKERELNISPMVYTFDELVRKMSKEPFDYLKLHEYQIEIGKLGEAFVYELECNKLKGTIYEDKVDNTKALDPSNGYDIFSYEVNGTSIYIEVKTTTSFEDNFYLTRNEYDNALRMKLNGQKYLIYLVKNILSHNKNEVIVEVIEDITENNEYLFEEFSWKVSKNKIS